MKITFLIISYILLLSGTKAQTISAEVCTWKNDKPAAVSISFDDASFTQYKFAYPILSKFGFKATYGLVVEWTKENPSYSSEPGMFLIKKMGWKQIRELYKSGNEIASHGYRHKKYDKHLPLKTLVSQIKKSKTAIEAKLNGKCYTIHYPYSFANEKIAKAAEEAGFLFGRTGKQNFNSATPPNMRLLNSYAILNDTIPTLNEFANLLDEAKDKWLILMYHHLFPKCSREIHILKFHNVVNTYSLYPETFEKQIKILKEKNYWVAPIEKIGKYIIERKNSKLTIVSKGSSFELKLNSKADTTLYNEPLTIKIKLDWEKVRVLQSKVIKNYKVHRGILLLNVLPGKSIKVEKL
jgi:peptidoglycan/xylan/chitin deacetylase (PgdA/CDA1 family)